MDRLWAPWRAQYIRDAPKAEMGLAVEDCFLCRAIAAPSTFDRENLVVCRRPNSVVMLNRFPYNNGHLLVAPLAHLGRLDELSGAHLVEPLETIKEMVAVLDRIFLPHGYTIGANLGKAAGAGLPGHLHWHVVPRWDGDTNFMPVLGQAKVIVESLYEFHDRFVAALAADQSGPNPSSACADTRVRSIADITIEP